MVLASWLSVLGVLEPSWRSGMDYLSAAHTVTGETFTMSAWVRTTNTTQTKIIMGLYDSSINDNGMFEMQMTLGNLLRAVINDGVLGSSNDFPTVQLNDGSWHFVVCSTDGSQLGVWLDGVADAFVAHSRTFPSIDTIAIGARVDLSPSEGWDRILVRSSEDGSACRWRW